MRNEPARNGTAGEGLLREVRTSQNARYLRTLPTFHAEEVLPENLRVLLRRLEAAEGDDGDGAGSIRRLPDLPG